MRVNLSTRDVEHARNICKNSGYSDEYLDLVPVSEIVSLALLLSDDQK